MNKACAGNGKKRRKDNERRRIKLVNFMNMLVLYQLFELNPILDAQILGSGIDVNYGFFEYFN